MTPSSPSSAPSSIFFFFPHSFFSSLFSSSSSVFPLIIFSFFFVLLVDSSCSSPPSSSCSSSSPPSVRAQTQRWRISCCSSLDLKRPRTAGDLVLSQSLRTDFSGVTSAAISCDGCRLLYHCDSLYSLQSA